MAKPSMTENIFMVSENCIMWCFRYALGRRTGAVSDVCDTLKRVWSDLEPSTQEQIKREITVAIEQGRAGAECDVKRWEEILNDNHKE